MKKLDLNKAAEEFAAISDEHQLFYNKQTGEFEFYIDPIYTGMDDDCEKYDGAEWIHAPDQRELNDNKDNRIPHTSQAEMFDVPQGEHFFIKVYRLIIFLDEQMTQKVNYLSFNLKNL